ncbi:hypothetical protein [Pseudomonas sp. CES]|uniref:hypothetical protein n=1 Tax=Pseudomonas sp. CES TaxID=2719586 RepID=UPI00147061C6|nr:hypothetical protein [Pseudomonas sp. CES]KAF4558715.1 hypothetical protein HBJ16_003706 [Pseudomonas sp. CES]
MNHNITFRPITIIEHSNLDIEALHPQTIVISGENIATNGSRYLDFGSLCYCIRKSRRNNRYTKYKGAMVDQNSLDPTRLATISKIIETARSQQSFATTIGLYATIKPFFDWIDSQEKACNFHNYTSLTEAYANYTQHLLERINSSGIRGNQLSLSSASSLQAAARLVISLSSGVHEKEVQLISTIIVQSHSRKHVDLKQPSADTQARTFAALINFVDEAHRILVEGGEFPMRLASPSSPPFYLYSLYQSTEKIRNAKTSIIRILENLPKFPTWEQAQKHLEPSQIRSRKSQEKGNYESVKKYHLESNSNPRCSLRLQIGNYAMTAGLMSFIAATACNLSVAQNLDINKAEVVPSTQGRRFYGAKPRADGKIVTPEFGARFTPVFKKILELRNWILNGRESYLVFPIVPQDSDYIGYVGTSALQRLKKVLQKYYPATTWVPAIQWRKNVSYQYITRSGGDTLLTAEKLSNTERTLAKNYSRPALEDFATQVTNFFEALHISAIARTRDSELIPVRINSKKTPETTTGIGGCEKNTNAEPRRTSGFTANAPKPSCLDPETCLFCDYYSVHADEEDIRRLLSLRYIIQASRPQQDHEHWQLKFGPTVHRVDEVLAAIGDSAEGLHQAITKIRDEVESGYLDPFWAIHFDTMVDIGVVV